MDSFDHIFFYLLCLGTLVYSILSEAKWRTRAKEAECSRDAIVSNLKRMAKNAEKQTLMDSVDELRWEMQGMKLDMNCMKLDHKPLLPPNSPVTATEPAKNPTEVIPN